MDKKTSRILVYIINTIIIVLNALISFIQQENTEVKDIALYEPKTAIIAEYVKG